MGIKRPKDEVDMPYCEKRKSKPFLRAEVCKSKNGCNGEYLRIPDICDFRPSSPKRVEKRKKK